MIRVYLFISLFVLSVVASSAEDKSTSISIGTYVGLHSPSLKVLNEGEFRSPITGFGTILDAQGQGSSQPFLFDNPLPKLGLSINSGMEFQWRMNSKNRLVFGVGVWESTSRASANGALPIQGEVSTVEADRLSTISYSELYFGIQRDFFVKPKRYKIYYRLTLHELFDIDYREDFVFNFTSGDLDGFKKIMVLQSQATGLLGLQFGSGVEYFLDDWLSVSLDAGYLMGFRKIELGDGRINTSFLSSDNITMLMPQRVGAGGRIEFVNPESFIYEKMKLSFDGWKVLFKMTLHF